jgi:hypothetical protein
MKELEYKFYSELRSNEIPLTQVPGGLKNSLLFKNLLRAKILDTKKSGRGSILTINNKEAFESFFANHFTDTEALEITKASNILRLRDSKARRVKAKPLFLLRGLKKILVNDQEVDLMWYTKTFGAFTAVEPTVKTTKICFVENLESFLKAEKLFGGDYVYVHKYGRIGIKSLPCFECTDVVAFVDYDFNGLDEYLRIKSHFPNTKLYVPENFTELFKKCSKQIKGKQKQSKRVAASLLREVIMIRELVARKNYFLEQEILVR